MENKKTSLFIEPISKVLTYVCPKLQRNLNEEHIKQMIEDQEIEFKKYGCFSMLQSITVANLNNTIYILDGQHRTKTFQELALRGYNLSGCFLPIVMYKVETSEELVKYYNRINKHMPIHPLELKETWEDYEKHIMFLIEDKYKAYVKNDTKTCRSPHISIPVLKTQLKIRNIGNKLANQKISCSAFCENILAVNSILKDKSSELAKIQIDPIIKRRIDDCKAKASKFSCEECFLGIWRKFEWLDIAFHITTTGKKVDDIHFSEFTRTRQKIPALVKERVWAKVNKQVGEGKCFVCEEKLLYKDMEIAHIQAHAFGGTDTEDNLMPTCKRCNRDCGIMNLIDYKNNIHEILHTMDTS